MRTLARLPGAVGSDLSAKLNVRGGVTDETLVRFDGLRLMNPFHLKDFPEHLQRDRSGTRRRRRRLHRRIPGELRRPHERRHRHSSGARRRSRSSRDRRQPLQRIRPRRRSIRPRTRRLGRVGAARKPGPRARLERHESRRAGVLGRLCARRPSASATRCRCLPTCCASTTTSSSPTATSRSRRAARYRDRYIWLRLDAHPRESLTGSSILARTDLESVRSGEADQPGISTRHAR